MCCAVAAAARLSVVCVWHIADHMTTRGQERTSGDAERKHSKTFVMFTVWAV